MYLSLRYQKRKSLKDIEISHKAFYFYMSISKDVDIESRGGAISQLTVPLSEMRDNRRMLSQEMFGKDDLLGRMKNHQALNWPGILQFGHPYFHQNRPFRTLCL